jgi:hypothetical protein
MNSLWDIRIFLGLVPKEPPCIMYNNTFPTKSLLKPKCRKVELKRWSVYLLLEHKHTSSIDEIILHPRDEVHVVLEFAIVSCVYLSRKNPTYRSF